jgi:hypothetical protein
MTSRLPGMFPAYQDNVLYFFDEKSLEEREYEFTSNYGMIPVNVMVEYDENGNTWNLVYDSHCYGTTLGTDELCYDGEEYDVFDGNRYDKHDIFNHLTLSWDTLSDWYNFFTDYYHLLNDWGHCGTAYSSATHYYAGESSNGYLEQLKYGSDRDTYAELDTLFEERGGIVSSYTCSATATTKVGNVVNYKCNFDKCSAHTIITESFDIGFYKWICDNIIPSFVIPVQYKDYWRRDRLYYPDVIKWYSWMNDRKSYSGTTEEQLEIYNCSASTDCCECEDWFNRGGGDMLNQMKTWHESVSGKIESNNDIVRQHIECAIPTIITPLSLQVSIDDLGEFSIFSKEYELGIDYRTVKTETGETGTIIHYEENNSNTGTVVTMNGESKILTGGTGFAYDERYMEKYVCKCNSQNCGYEGYFTDKCPKCGGSDISIIGWSAYTPSCTTVACSFEEYDDAYRMSNSGYTTADTPTRTAYTQGDLYYYTFNKDNVRIVADTEDELRSKLAVKYPIERRDAIFINGTLYDIQREEFGVYDQNSSFLSGKTFFVYREEYTDTPYTIINGKKIYADFYPFSGTCSQFFYFPFFKQAKKDNDSTCSASTFNPGNYKPFPRTRTTLKDKDYIEFITYAGTQHIVSESGVTINDIEHPRICSGTCDTPDGELLITNVTLNANYDYEVSQTGNIIYHLNGSNIDIYDQNVEEYTVIPAEFVVQKKVDDNIDVYVGGILSGTSGSKIYNLRSNSLLNDDIANVIEGLYDIGNKYNHQPPEGERLEPIYQVGNVANIQRFSLTIEDQKDLPKSTTAVNYFIGDIITKMRFYYRDVDGEEVAGTSFEAATPVNGEYTSLAAINLARAEKARIEQLPIGEDDHKILFDDDIYCDITYYIGATLQRSGDTTTLAGETSPYQMAVDTGNKKFSSGVCYNETVKFVETEVQYYLRTEDTKQIPTNKNKASAHTISYPVVCYTLVQVTEKIKSHYDNYYYDAMATFTMPMKADTVDFMRYNGKQTIPVFREEYKMGTACPQNTDINIYIDRKVNAAFEKHLKLGEVTSLEALEQYTNGYFKIQN